MILFDFKSAWEDYKYYVVVVAILLVLLLVVTITCVVSSLKKKKNEKEDSVYEYVELSETPRNLDEKEETKEEVVEETPVEIEPVVAKETARVSTPKEETVKVEEETKPVETKEVVKPTTKALAKPKTTTARGKYEIVPHAEGFKYILKASNGESLIVSENYTSVAGCKSAIKRLQENSKDADIKVEQDKKNNYQFHVIRGSRVLAHSANYSTKASAQNAANSFLKFVNSTRMEVVDAKKAVDQPELVELAKYEINTETVGKIVVTNDDEEYFYRLYANNGQIICTSPSYKTLATIKKSITNFQEAVYNGKFYMTVDKNGNYQFKLYGTTNRLILTGESFTSKETCRSNIESCYRFAKNAVIEGI